MERIFEIVADLPGWTLVFVLIGGIFAIRFLMIQLLPADMCGPGGWLIDTDKPFVRTGWTFGDDGLSGDGDDGGD